jgi:hypothetical protein
LQRLENKVLRTTGNFPRLTSVRDMHVALYVPYVYDYIKLYRRQAEIIHNHNNENLFNIGQGETLYTENTKGLNLAAVIYTNVYVFRLP